MLSGSFSYGIIVGTFKIPPYEILNVLFDKLQGKEDDYPILDTYVEFDIASIIHITSEQDILEKRAKLINYVFKDNETFLTKIPDSIESNIVDDRYSDMENLERIDRFSILMEYGVNSYPYLFLAKDGNNKLVVYHQGHDGDFVKGKETIRTLLQNKYSVLAFSMPLTGQNTNPVIESEHFGKFKLVYHNDLQFLETENFSPLKFFIEPVSSSLNYLDQQYDFEHYYMMGISGGGWTTGVYSAIDPRIEKSFPVAGTAPMFLRFNNPKNMGDYEQTVPKFYMIANYLDQYIMASYGDGREQLQIFNKYDPCCLSGDQYKTYEDEIQGILSQLGKGNFSIFIDENNQYHSISSISLDKIIQMMDAS
ncbi:hypothetical protein QVH35_02415 [Candidatus Nitrosotenuis chungbukensis]|uniref:hypothetical protein n=1 Tax=Candidatus Nitrosotenuis chungbukensis TaxID=1353246 RepID=UPI002672C8E8|nr:hypothetical protein [Candidatus Nitrosotenuis chungbukensis]WKT58329.1 hypothetical protein QVH35_02415 [Candidatus Nitrosotenuis chungbukensis]